jgi:predicted nucleotidyltransferase component of viral defense system
MAADVYEAQAQLLVRVLPFVATETCFALKGGTAINLFVRDMPRLSVDIDLTYLPIAERAPSLQAIAAALSRIRERIERGIPRARTTIVRQHRGNDATGLAVAADRVQIKIEVTPVLRGCVFAPETRRVRAKVEDRFGFAEIQVVSLADLYAGKFAAALDRQHPRDLFDVLEFLSDGAIDDDLRRAFAIYLVSHSRPMAEVLGGSAKDMTQAFARGFDGMTARPVALADLIDARLRLIDGIAGKMPAAHKRFLLSVERGAPDWPLISTPGADKLPAVLWRLQNIASLTQGRRAANAEKLAAVLGLDGA